MNISAHDLKMVGECGKRRVRTMIAMKSCVAVRPCGGSITTSAPSIDMPSV